MSKNVLLLILLLYVGVYFYTSLSLSFYCVFNNFVQRLCTWLGETRVGWDTNFFSNIAENIYDRNFELTRRGTLPLQTVLLSYVLTSLRPPP